MKIDREYPILIDIEGTDGSGKQTQVELLRKKFTDKGYKVKVFSFPNYESDSSIFVKQYLNGDFGGIEDKCNEYRASMIFAVDRLITYMKEIQPCINNKEADVIIFDRYIGSNLIHQGAKLVMNRTTKTDVLDYFVSDWYNIEVGKLGLPEPDITLYLNMPYKYGKVLRKNRMNKITGESKQDIHESNDEYCKVCNDTGLRVAEFLGWNVIECVKKIKFFHTFIKDIDIISSDIVKIINNEFGGLLND